MENQNITNRQKVEDILIEVHDKCTSIKVISDYKNNTIQYPFQGKIGGNVTFKGETRVNQNNDIDSVSATVELKVKNRKLGQIITDRGFVAKMGGQYFRGNWYGRKDAVRDTTEITVVSPNYREKDGVLTRTQDTAFTPDQVINQLNVYHAANETADAVIDNMRDAIVQSKQAKSTWEKLSQFVMPMGKTKIQDSERQM